MFVASETTRLAYRNAGCQRGEEINFAMHLYLTLWGRQSDTRRLADRQIHTPPLKMSQPYFPMLWACNVTWQKDPEDVIKVKGLWDKQIYLGYAMGPM